MGGYGWLSVAIGAAKKEEEIDSGKIGKGNLLEGLGYNTTTLGFVPG